MAIEMSIPEARDRDRFFYSEYFVIMKVLKYDAVLGAESPYPDIVQFSSRRSTISTREWKTINYAVKMSNLTEETKIGFWN